jgi:serine/threonine-protein kinase
MLRFCAFRPSGFGELCPTMRVCPACRAKYDEQVQTCPRDGMPLLEVSRTFARMRQEEATPAPEVTPEMEEREDDSPDLAVGPGMMVGEYMVERTIAEGGMGAIYAGIHPVISKRVAIKVISKRYAQDPKAVGRFVLEARSVNQIGHHNIVDIFSIGELDDRRNYLVMELLDGLALNQILLRVKRLKPGELLPVYEQLCDALDAAHKKGFIHRDLKPDNVIVLRRPPRPFIKILDFGLAKLRGSAVSHNTEVGTVLGTPEYMAPEQCRGAHVDARTDVYALGVMAYELLAGQKPFYDPSPLRILAMQQHAQPTPLGRHVNVGRRLEAVVVKAMSKDPTARYASTKELIQELRVAVPEALPWTAEMVSWGEAPAAAQSESPTGDGPESENLTMPPEIKGLAPLTISGETSAISGELEDDYVETLVSEPKARPAHEAKARPAEPDPEDAVRTAPQPRPAPEPIGKVQSGEVEDEPRTAVDDVGEGGGYARPEGESPAGAPPLRPQPALSTPSSAEMLSDMAESTEVDDEGPVVLVDRPIHEARTSESREFELPPPDLRPAKPARPAAAAPPIEGIKSITIDLTDLDRPPAQQQPQLEEMPTMPVPTAALESVREAVARGPIRGGAARDKRDGRERKPQPRPQTREELALGKTIPAGEMAAELKRREQLAQPAAAPPAERAERPDGSIPMARAAARGDASTPAAKRASDHARLASSARKAHKVQLTRLLAIAGGGLLIVIVFLLILRSCG